MTGRYLPGIKEKSNDFSKRICQNHVNSQN